jgi:hypothetical protein
VDFGLSEFVDINERASRAVNTICVPLAFLFIRQSLDALHMKAQILPNSCALGIQVRKGCGQIAGRSGNEVGNFD